MYPESSLRQLHVGGRNSRCCKRSRSREAIVKEIARLKEREALEAAKSAAATGPITKKILELSEESITEVVRDTFTRETDRLRLER